MAKGELTPDQAMANLLGDAEPEESEIYKAIKNDTNGIDEGDLNHLEGEEGDEGHDSEDEFENEDEDMDNDNAEPGYDAHDEA